MAKRLSRRTVLRGAGGVAIGLPFLEVMRDPRPARAGYGDAARRLVVVYSPHGRPQGSEDKWRPQGTGPVFTLSELMAPLMPHQQDMIALTGLELSSARNQGGNGHSKGPTHALTATDHLDETIPGDMSMGTIGFAGGISVDQKIAGDIAADTQLKFPSLQFGVQSGADFAVNGATTRSYIAYAGPGEPIPAEDNPAAMFERLFGDFDADELELAKRTEQRRSILDLVTEDFERLNPTVSSSDRVRLEEHLSKIREIELSLGVTADEVSPQCAMPDLGPAVDDYKNNANFPIVGQQQTDMLTMALACDMTRVATFQWSTGQSTTRHTWVEGAGDKGHHGITHDGSPGTAAYENILVWYAERVAELVSQLKATEEADGSNMLDNTVVLWIAGEMGYADAHNFIDMPYVLFGGGNGILQTGQHLEFQGRAHNDLLVTLIQAMGLPDTTFGKAEYVTGPLEGVLA
ncbi:MAG: DUF1552 domain-containing protein [Myxococcota bacterium]